jgi:hypothetical protein
VVPEIPAGPGHVSGMEHVLSKQKKAGICNFLSFLKSSFLLWRNQPNFARSHGEILLDLGGNVIPGI